MKPNTILVTTTCTDDILEDAVQKATNLANLEANKRDKYVVTTQSITIHHHGFFWYVVCSLLLTEYLTN